MKRKEIIKRVIKTVGEIAKQDKGNLISAIYCGDEQVYPESDLPLFSNR